MKKIKTIYKWILISVILQTAFLAWLNYIYLPNRGHFRSTMYEMEFQSVRDRSIRLPEGAAGIAYLRRLVCRLLAAGTSWWQTPTAARKSRGSSLPAEK